MNLPEFVRESNLIEGIHRDPSKVEIKALDDFLQLEEPGVYDLQVYVSIVQPGAVLRDCVGLDVWVGKHIPPKGGPDIKPALEEILYNVIDSENPYEIHAAYETLHPFTDGNGRSGRALWAWHMWNLGLSTKLGFLHTWYYQSLQNSGARK